MAKIGVADTTFATVDMARFAINAIKANSKHQIERYTVPGIKDLAVAAKRLFREHGCDIVLALGMVGPKPIDKQCSHEATLGLQRVQLDEGKHILEVFVHMDEAKTSKEIFEIVKDRSTKHALNAIALLKGKEELTPRAGTGRRQGHADAGPLKL